MAMAINDLCKRIQVSAKQTQESIKKNAEVNPKVLQQLVEDIGALTKDPNSVIQVQMPGNASDIEDAISSLTSIEQMIGTMKEKETDVLVQSMRKAIIGELEGNARVELSNLQITTLFFQEKTKDLKSLFKTKQKVEKVYKPKRSS
jgi:hypothetical protein